uniref:Uncharacterized protein n=1 Tax=Rhizophora mucronata TaxID=61149 RepID=A0A2P2Q117_RHIMU
MKKRIHVACPTNLVLRLS